MFVDILIYLTQSEKYRDLWLTNSECRHLQMFNILIIQLKVIFYLSLLDNFLISNQTTLLHSCSVVFSVATALRKTVMKSSWKQQHTT